MLGVAFRKTYDSITDNNFSAYARTKDCLHCIQNTTAAELMGVLQLIKRSCSVAFSEFAFLGTKESWC